MRGRIEQSLDSPAQIFPVLLYPFNNEFCTDLLESLHGQQLGSEKNYLKCSDKFTRNNQFGTVYPLIISIWENVVCSCV
jgi:hypothetical protein